MSLTSLNTDTPRMVQAGMRDEGMTGENINVG